MDFNNTGAMRSPFSPRLRQTIAGRRPISLSSTKKNQSKYIQSGNEQTGDIIYKTPSLTMETHGLPLPVMVTEALTFGSGDVSVRMSECGWCWLVTGRRILTWPHSLSTDDSSSLGAGGVAARELTLPQTDLAHKADLVMVFYSDGAQMPSCVGVSPEGVVRYWPSVAAESASDVTCELAGQECDRLEPARGSLVLATTTCTLVLITPQRTEGRHTVACRTLRPPSGWLGGLGRRVSHMFFGAMPAHAEARLVGVVCTGGDAAAPHLALVAGGPVLQLWRGAELHEHSLRRALADEPQLAAGEGELRALDVRAAGAELLLLLGAAGRLALVRVALADPARPAVRALALVRAPADAPRLLPLGARALLFAPGYVALAERDGEAELAVLAADGDRVLAAAPCGARALLFSRKHGVLLLSVADAAAPAPSAGDSPLGSPGPADADEGNLSLFEIDPHELSGVTSDAAGKLKTAFLFHVRRAPAACRALLQELFPRDEAGERDAALARTALAVARELLDDAPAGDPRWRRGAGAPTRVALGGSAALHVAAQLRDKRRALALYRDFLLDAGLLRRAGPVTVDGGAVVRADAALAALAEQLAAATALRAAHDAAAGPAPLIAAAIERVVAADADAEEPEVARALAAGALSAADVSFRRVTRTGRVLAELARAPPPPHSPAAAADHALATVALLTDVLAEMQKTRAQWGAAAPPALGPRALLPALLELLRRAVTRQAAGAGATRAALLDAAAALAARTLLAAEPLAAEPRTRALYERMRRDAIAPFVEAGQAERALALADQFQDLELLVELCVAADDDERLERYIQKYEDQGMAETAYSWLAQRGGAAAARLVRMRGGARLAAWLAAAPSRAPLAALRALPAQPANAAALLAAVADAEADSVERMAVSGASARAPSSLSPARARRRRRRWPSCAPRRARRRARGGAPTSAWRWPSSTRRCRASCARATRWPPTAACWRPRSWCRCTWTPGTRRSPSTTTRRRWTSWSAWRTPSAATSCACSCGAPARGATTGRRAPRWTRRSSASSTSCSSRGATWRWRCPRPRSSWRRRSWRRCWRTRRRTTPSATGWSAWPSAARCPPSAAAAFSSSSLKNSVFAERKPTLLAGPSSARGTGIFNENSA